MSDIKFFSLEAQHKSLQDAFLKCFNNTLKRGNFILGNELELFEQEFASYCGARYAVGVGSGTEALHLSLLACDIGEGDEVITTPNTFIATVLAISYARARPLFVDVREDTYNIDCDALETLIKKRKHPPKAIIPVHLYGNAAEMRRIVEITKKYKIKVIEDACQAHGALYNNRKLGTFGDAGCFSFYPTKNLGCIGDGGMVITNNKKIYKKLLLMRNYGREKRYSHQIKGFNSRLDEFQAAILRIKLKRLDQWNQQRRKKAHYYTRLLKNSEVITPTETENSKHVYHLYVIRSKNRDKLQKFLKDKGIETLIHYPIPIHLQKAYNDLGYSKGSFKVAELYASQVLSLPMYPEIKLKDIEKVSEAINNFFNTK